MTNNQDQLKYHLDDLYHTIAVAEINYQIWWVYKSENTRPKYIEAMNDYIEFFALAFTPILLPALVALYRLYETRNDTFNFRGTLKLLEENLSAEAMAEAKAEYESAKLYWIKVQALRNKVFGHRSNQNTISEIFEQVGIAPDDIVHLINISKRLLNKISYAGTRTTYEFPQNATEATVRLLDDLKAIRERHSQ